MKKNKTEQRIYEAADKLTPEPPAFSSLETRVDWQDVTNSVRPVKKKRRWLIPVILTASACLAAAVAGSIVFSLNQQKKTYYGAGEDRPILYGNFVAEGWGCTDPSLDFSSMTLAIDQNESEQSTGKALVYDRKGAFCYAATFSNGIWAAFEFGSFTLLKAMPGYRGEAHYMGDVYIFEILFPLENDAKKRIEVSFGDPSLSMSGSVYFS